MKPQPHYLELECSSITQVKPALACLLHTLVFHRCYQFNDCQDATFVDPIRTQRNKGLTFAKVKGSKSGPSHLDADAMVEHACKQVHRYLDLGDDSNNNHGAIKDALIKVQFGTLHHQHQPEQQQHPRKSPTHTKTNFFWNNNKSSSINNVDGHQGEHTPWEEWHMHLKLIKAGAEEEMNLEGQLRALLIYISKQCVANVDVVPALSSDAQSFQVKILTPQINDSVSLASMLKRMILETSTSLFPALH